MLTAELIREKVGQREYRLSAHAETEREADAITLADIEEAFTSETCEIVESYPDDPRGESCLALGFTIENDPLHAVIGKSDALLIFVTLYGPDPDLWENWRSRKG